MLAKRIRRAAKKPSVPPVGGVTGKFTTTTDGRILDPDGNTFIPIGANLGSAMGGNQQGTATGHSAEVQAWGWNAIRLFVVQTTAVSWSLPAQSLASSGSAAAGYAQVFQVIDGIVNEYTAKGIVVMIENHDLFAMKDMSHGGGLNNAYIGEIDTFWHDCAERYKNNTYVWYNLDNEPIWSDNQAWYDLHEHHLTIVRSHAPDNIVVIDAMAGGGDVGPHNDSGLENTKFTTDPTMAPALTTGQKNIVLSMHNYGGYNMYTTIRSYMDYVDSIHAIGLPLLIGEIGYTWNGSWADAGPYENNLNGAIAVFEAAATKNVGLFWWHGSMNTTMSLKNNGGGFYTGGLNVNLSDAGQRLWNVGHDIGSEPQNMQGTSSGTQITLTWSPPLKDVGNLTGFTLYRDGTLLATLDAATYTYTDTTSQYGTDYLYQIKAITNGTERTSSYYLRYMAIGGMATPPQNVIVSFLSGTSQNKLTWDAPDTITGTLNGYNVYRNGGKLTGTPYTAGLYFIDYGANAATGKTYTYKVAAVVDNSEQPGTTVSFTVP